MRKVGIILCALLLPALLVFAIGCGGGGDAKKNKDKQAENGDNGDNGEGKKTKLEVSKWGSLKGRIVYDGDPPPLEDEPLLTSKDKETCHDAKTATKIELSKQAWLVNQDNKGVANVLVKLEAPEDKYFPIPDEDKTRKETVVLDQPHCQFVPHVVAIYPEYLDGYDDQGNPQLKKTGQEFVVKNSAPIAHNTKSDGADQLVAGNSNFNYVLQSKEEKVLNDGSQIRIHPQRDKLGVSCDIHQWMKGYVWSFNHPFHAVSTGGSLKDKADDWGKFEIKRVPAGVPVRIVIWHEDTGGYEITSPSGFDATNGKEITFKEGENTLEIKIKKKG